MAEDATAVFDQVSTHDSNSLMSPDMVTMILSNEERGPNVTTAAWWMLAEYDPFRYLLSVDHRTLTYELIESNPEFVMAVPTTDLIDAVSLSGLVSGREVDKLAHLGLETVPGTAVDVPSLTAAVGNIECRVTESFEFEGNTYYFRSPTWGRTTSTTGTGRKLGITSISTAVSSGRSRTPRSSTTSARPRDGPATVSAWADRRP